MAATKRELDDLHFQLAALYRAHTEGREVDWGLVADYWREIDAVEADIGSVGGWLTVAGARV